VKKRARFRWVLAPVAAFHVLILCPGFFAPYDYAEQNRELPFAPPTRLHFVDTLGSWHFRPFVYRWSAREDVFAAYAYQEDRARSYPLRFFVQGARYRIAGIIPSSWHLLGADGEAPVFLFGTDNFGRDQFSRFLYGGRISLLAGLLAALISLTVGGVLGGLSGFYGKWPDSVIMRIAELFLTLPWLYLLFAVRAFLPLAISPQQAFLLLVLVIGSIGWAKPARLVRGLVLSVRERPFVLAARGFGASDIYLLRRHILPEAYSVLLTQAAILVPQFILAEVTLSFLGLGVAEPAPSWGNLLSNLQKVNVLTSYWWMAIPALALIPVFLGYHWLAEGLQAKLGVAPL